MKKKLLMMVSTFALLTGGLLIIQSEAEAKLLLSNGVGSQTEDSTIKQKPLTPQERTQQVEKHFNRLIKTDTVTFIGERDSLGRCMMSSRTPGLDTRGRMVKQSFSIVNKATCEYESIRSIYGTDSAEVKSESTNRLADFTAGIRVDFSDKLSPMYSGVYFLFEIRFDPYGCVSIGGEACRAGHQDHRSCRRSA